MKIPLPSRLKKVRKTTAEEVIRSELREAYAIHPGHLMPSSITSALDEAGYRIISHDDLENEIALAYQAGVDAASGA